jgi:type I restriction enzyme R subunit
MNEEETRAEYIDPKLKVSGWGEVEDSRIRREYQISPGRIQSGGNRLSPEKADYLLVYKNQNLAVIEAKKLDLPKTEGLTQAKDYAQKLQTPFTYSTNGKEIYEVNMVTGEERDIDNFPTPEELWKLFFTEKNVWKDEFSRIAFEDAGGTKQPRYYQEIAVNRVMGAIADNKDRILLTLATGTGKTFIAFQIAWKLFKSRWTLQRDGKRQPRILFLTDRNILADQAFNAFNSFPEDAMIRINPMDIRKKGSVPKNASIFFTIFQTFMTGKDNSYYYGDYPEDFFDLIVIDECHRGGANDEGNWRGILEYFKPAVQLGLTATPKRKDNIDTYKYFGEPVYTYSLKQGVNDGFLTPFRVKRIQTNLDEYVYTSDDEIVEGEVEQGKVYEENDFNNIIEIKEREAKRVKLFLEAIDQNEKSIVFCANQAHASVIRDLVNQYKLNKDPFYCVRVTANDGARGDQYLRDFQDNEKTIPTILTTSQKLSTGVDARNVRNIILMRPINSMIEFKQIIGRGTRLFEGKEYFTIIDFVNAYKHFSDPEWDGEPTDIDVGPPGKPPKPPVGPKPPPGPGPEPKIKLKIKLADGKEEEIQHMVSVSFWSADGKPLSVQEFLNKMYGFLPELFNSEEELRKIWSDPRTRKALLEKLAVAGYGADELLNLQKLVNAENSDLFDVLDFLAYSVRPISRKQRVSTSKKQIFDDLNSNEKDFLNFVLNKYVESGVDELDEEKLPVLLNLKYNAIADAEETLGGVDKIRSIFFDFQKKLYVASK